MKEGRDRDGHLDIFGYDYRKVFDVEGGDWLRCTGKVLSKELLPRVLVRDF